MHFGENQLSPGSVGFSPLTTGHPNLLQQIRVRASFRLSSELTLPMVSSPGFGSTLMYLVAQLGLAFTTPADDTPLS